MFDKITTIIRIDRIDKHGNIFIGKEQKANSWVANFIKMLSCYIRNVNITNIVKTDGDNGSYGYGSTFDTFAEANDDTHGIIIGTGNTAVTINDYAIESIISDGSSAGELLYSAMAYDSCANSPSNTWFFNVNRTFNNDSGGSITIKESALYAYENSVYAMIERTVLTTPYSIADAEGCVVNYKISLTV